MQYRVALLAVVLALASVSAAADVYRLLDEPSEAAQARVDAIQQARSEVHALYFLARDDRIALSALALLRDAKRRGVGSVRLVVDANFSHIPKAVLAHLRDEGVEIRVYHPIRLRHPSWLFRRMHEKVVIVDGARYITGGRNLADAYFGLAKKNYVDRDVYVEGPSAADANEHFESVWNSRHVADLRVRVTQAEKLAAAERLTNALTELECSGFIRLDTNRDWAADVEPVDGVTFVGPRVAAKFAEVLEGARESIIIESPYVVPSRAMLELLERKAAAGVKVKVLTNSLRSCDGVLPQAGYLKYRRRLLRAGIDLREYKGPDMLHAKTAVVDSRVVVVGSYNLDHRSERLNTEVICVTDDEAVAHEALASIDEHLGNAWTIAARREWHLPRALRFRAWAFRMFLLPIVEGQL